MQFNRLISGLVVAAVLCPGIAAAKSHKATHSAHRASNKAHNARIRGKKFKKGTWKSHGQQAINEERTREIQEALIREHYLDGEATGIMDQRTKNALIRLQSDNGWQKKVVPDARALIKLGLGPKHEGILNPETAAISTSSIGRAQR